MLRLATDEEKSRFSQACSQVLFEGEAAEGGIGTLSEKTLHAVLKRFYEPDETCREQKVGAFVADICKGDRIIEIQTRNLYSLPKKLAAYLAAGYHVTVVHPVAAVRASCTLGENGEVVSKRVITRKGTVTAAFRELYGMRAFLQNDAVDLRLPLLDVTDYRRMKNRDRVDRVPNGLLSQVYLCDASDYLSLLPDTLPETFTAKELNGALSVPAKQKSFTAGVFAAAGAIEECGKNGKAKLYRKCE